VYDLFFAAVVALPIALWFAFFVIHHGHTYELDNGLGNGSFYGTFALYRRLAYTIMGVASVGANVSAYENWPPAAIILAAAAIYALLFNAWLMISYESYLQARSYGARKSNYSGWKYALTIALGFSSLGFFITGFVIFLITLTGR
jgi:hypothetical protein